MAVLNADLFSNFLDELGKTFIWLASWAFILDELLK
jgi:hypothetical protein